MLPADLPQDLERFAEDCVRRGRFASVDEVHRAALRLLQQVEGKRDAFAASLDAAMEEGHRDGFIGAEEALRSLDAEIEAALQARSQAG